jgi:hypothetical protein
MATELEKPTIAARMPAEIGWIRLAWGYGGGDSDIGGSGDGPGFVALAARFGKS